MPGHGDDPAIKLRRYTQPPAIGRCAIDHIKRSIRSWKMLSDLHYGSG
jgi:hypothetical protein